MTAVGPSGVTDFVTVMQASLGFLPCGTSQLLRLPSDARYPYQHPMAGVQSSDATPAGAIVLTFLVPLRLYWSQHAVSCAIPLADVTWYANEEDATTPTVSNAVNDRFMDVTSRRARKHPKVSPCQVVIHRPVTTAA